MFESTLEHLKEENSQLKIKLAQSEARNATLHKKLHDYRRAIESWRKAADVSDTLRIQVLTQISIVMPVLDAWARYSERRTKENSSVNHGIFINAIQNLRRLSRGENL